MTNYTPTRIPKNPDARHAMRDAWRLARRGQTLYGGKVRDYLAEALRIAWAEVKADPIVQECKRIIAATRARKAAGTWRHPALTARRYGYGGAWIGQ